MMNGRRWGTGSGSAWKFCPVPLTFLRLGDFAPKLKRIGHVTDIDVGDMRKVPISL